MKQPQRMNQPQNKCGAVRLLHSASRASTRPKKPLPASPMKIRAGGKFQHKKPPTQAAKRTATAQSPAGWTSHQITAPPAATQMASTLAMPSIPSMKLKRLIDQTTYSADNNTDATPRSKVPPRIGTAGSGPI